MRPAIACLAVGLLTAAITASAQPTTTTTTITLRVASDSRPSWSGLVGPIDGDPDSASTLPAFGVIGIVVSAARGVADGQSQQEAARTRQQQADRTLEPVRAALDRYDAAALWKDTADHLSRARIATTIVAPDAVAPRDAWTIDVTPPRFMLASDLGALVVDAVVALRPPGSTAEPVKTAVRVVSPAGLGDTWKADDARALKAEAATMLAHAVEQALWHEQRGKAMPEPRQRTHRYPLATDLRAERGWLLREGCARIVVRTLRKALLSVPRPAAAATCDAPYRLPS